MPFVLASSHRSIDSNASFIIVINKQLAALPLMKLKSGSSLSPLTFATIVSAADGRFYRRLPRAVHGSLYTDDARVDHGKALCTQPEATAALAAATSKGGMTMLARFPPGTAAFRGNMVNLIIILAWEAFGC